MLELNNIKKIGGGNLLRLVFPIFAGVNVKILTPLKSTCHSEGEARKNPADSLKSWIASRPLAMTTLLQDYCHFEQVRAEDESVAYPFNASTVSEESHKSIPAPCGRGSEGEGVTLDKFCEKWSEPVCVADSGSIQFDEKA
ncbi:MAG: hypothetical protein NC191_06135, partial [Muribaculaceae bacterium]|nr:hypothetical protein [Muribaculaceae bacterium]